MKDKIIVSMSSFNRLGYCLDAVLNIRRQDRNIPIVIAVEQEQYQLYKTLLNRYAYVFPLPEKLKGIGYSTYYSLKLMRDLNYRYVLRCDDDTMIKFKPEIMLDVFSKHKDTAWVAGWVSYYDWGYRKYAQNKDGTVECTIASQCYALDLNKIVFRAPYLLVQGALHRRKPGTLRASFYVRSLAPCRGDTKRPGTVPGF